MSPGLIGSSPAIVREGRLRFTTSLAEAVAASNVYFIAVGTPPNEDGSADLAPCAGSGEGLGAADRRLLHDS